MNKIIKKQIGENPPPMKVVLLCLKAACGVVGSTMAITASYPIVAFSFLVVGAVCDQVLTSYKWDNK